MSEIGLQKRELDTPLLWTDLDLMENNIASLAEHFETAGVSWRPHTKGIKIPAIAHIAIEAGAIGVTCAKLGEAEVMAAAGIKDILIANQVVGAKKITRLTSILRHADVKVAIDNETNLAELGAAGSAKDVEVGVVVEVDTGMHRAGVTPGQPTVALSRAAHETRGVRYLGLMGWEGHAVSIEDPEAKRQEIEESVGKLASSAKLCREAGLPVRIVSCGGSGTYKVTPFLAGVTEIQAGGAIFSDVRYRSWGVETEPSLYVQSTVTSRPVADRIIFDAGFKALPDWAGTPKPVGLSDVKSIGMSAEHGTVTLEKPNNTVEVGDVFDFIVGYGDSTVFLYDKLYGIREGTVEVIWSIQGRGKLR